MKNLLVDIPSELTDELVETLAGSDSVRIERIVSQGHASPADFWYDQPQNEWIVLLEGAAKVRFEHEVIELQPGDHLVIPAHRRHRVEWTSPNEPTVWLAVHYS